MNTKLLRVLNDKYTWIGYGDGEKLKELFSLLAKEQILLADAYTKLDQDWTPLKCRILVKPLDDTKQWTIHISYGRLSDDDIKRLEEQGDIEGLIDTVIHKRNFDKIRVNTNPSLADDDPVYSMALDIIADYFKMTHSTETHIAFDYNVDFLNTCKIIDHSPRPKKYNEHRATVNGVAESKYLGTRSSYEEICMYNKKLERKVKGKPLVGYTQLDEEMFRLEVRFHGKESLENFMKGKNPLEHIKFYKGDTKIKLSELKKRFREDTALGLFTYINMMDDTEELKLHFPTRTLRRYKQIVKDLLEEFNDKVIDPYKDYEKHKSHFIEEMASYQRKFTGNELNFSNLN